MGSIRWPSPNQHPFSLGSGTCSCCQNLGFRSSDAKKKYSQSLEETEENSYILFTRQKESIADQGLKNCVPCSWEQGEALYPHEGLAYIFSFGKFSKKPQLPSGNSATESTVPEVTGWIAFLKCRMLQESAGEKGARCAFTWSQRVISFV